jgi:5'-deoxynucleotidase YfbR-like HD superfamily hydrolase
VLITYVNHGLAADDQQNLGKCIVFHDICEVLIGDYPAYTDAGPGLPPYDPAQLEELGRAADTLIRPWLRPKLKLLSDFDAAIEILSVKSRPLTRFVTLIDKIDPIIAIWRYLHQFRGKFGDGSAFIEVMDAFFANTNVGRVCAECNIDKERTSKLLEFMQVPDNARRYYADPNVLGELAHFAGLHPAMPKRLIEGRSLSFAARPRRKVKNHAASALPHGQRTLRS